MNRRPSADDQTTTDRRHPCAEFVLVHAGGAPATESSHVASAASRPGGEPREGARAFYTDDLLRDRPPDVELIPVSQTFRQDRIIEESVVRFTHTVDVDWMLRGAAPEGHKVEFTLVGVITGIAPRADDRPFVHVGCHRRTPAA